MHTWRVGGGGWRASTCMHSGQPGSTGSTACCAIPLVTLCPAAGPAQHPLRTPAQPAAWTESRWTCRWVGCGSAGGVRAAGRLAPLHPEHVAVPAPVTCRAPSQCLATTLVGGCQHELPCARPTKASTARKLSQVRPPVSLTPNPSTPPPRPPGGYAAMGARWHRSLEDSAAAAFGEGAPQASRALLLLAGVHGGEETPPDACEPLPCEPLPTCMHSPATISSAARSTRCAAPLKTCTTCATPTSCAWARCGGGGCGEVRWRCGGGGAVGLGQHRSGEQAGQPSPGSARGWQAHPPTSRPFAFHNS